MSREVFLPLTSGFSLNAAFIKALAETQSLLNAQWSQVRPCTVPQSTAQNVGCPLLRGVLTKCHRAAPAIEMNELPSEAAPCLILSERARRRPTAGGYTERSGFIWTLTWSCKYAGKSKLNKSSLWQSRLSIHLIVYFFSTRLPQIPNGKKITTGNKKWLMCYCTQRRVI